MFIFICTDELDQYKDDTFRVQDTEREAELLNAGYRRHDREFIIIEKHRRISLICPEFRNEAKGLEAIVIIPDFFVPRRPYPVYVYLYAIDLYSSSPDKGQRWAAEETRKRFGLPTFAHTTLGRALKSFVRMIAGNPTASEGSSAEAPCDAKAPAFPTTKSTKSLRECASQFLAVKLDCIDRRQTVASYCGLARDWFREYQRFLL